jgi:cytochrome c553
MRLHGLNRGLAVAVAAMFAGIHQGAAETIEDKAAVCLACHGEKGMPADEAIPILFGQNEGYIYIELRDMKKGARKNEQMAPIVENMSREDMLALAAYFSAKPWPNLQQPRASPAEAARFASMAASAQCPACHQAGYVGAGTQPHIAGQAIHYLAKTMFDFRSGARANSDWMRDLLKTFSEDDVKLMTRVLSGM